jgi:hypothetical protein
MDKFLEYLLAQEKEKADIIERHSGSKNNKFVVPAVAKLAMIREIKAEYIKWKEEELNGEN